MHSDFAQANQCYLKGLYSEAVQFYRKAIAQRPNWYLYHANLSRALLGMGKQEEAKAALEAAERLLADSGRVPLNLHDVDGEGGVFYAMPGMLPFQSNAQRKVYAIKDLEKAQRSVTELRRKLLSLGFYQTALTELKAQTDAINPARRLVASRELALYYLNQGTSGSAEQARPYIDYCLKNEQNDSYYRKALVMKAECIELRGKVGYHKSFCRAAIKEVGEFPDLLLAGANAYEPASRRLEAANKIYRKAGLAPVALSGGSEEAYNQLMLAKGAVVSPLGAPIEDAPLITVIVPTYNAEDTLKVALQSVLAQTWANIEVLVVDDCSTDGTAAVVKRFAEADSRIKLISAECNGGPYIARNLALLEAKGDYITTNDADDWSHPQKLEVQARHLLNNPDVLGNTSQQARATPDLKFHRRGNYGYYIFMNMSSFMFRREVLKDVGFWDSVRFGADSEFIRRIKKVHGKDSIADLPTVPLSFQRQSEDSLTGNSAFGYHGFFMGARREHFESYLHFHTENTTARYDFPMCSRPFEVPGPLRPERVRKNAAGQREFDVVIISDFRLDGGSTLSSIEEIKAHLAAGLTTALVQMSRYDYPPKKKINPKVRALLEEGKVEFVVYGERVKCQHAILRYPPVLQHRQSYVPDIEADNFSIIVNQPPMSDYGPEAQLRYNIPRADAYARELFATQPAWRPIGPAVREALKAHHCDDLGAIDLADEDWTNVIDVEHWQRGDYTPNKQKPVIGRHSRDNHHKWPDARDMLLNVYPDSNKVTVRVLGGAGTPASILGKLPDNWQVHEFGELHPREFLQGLDVFVYYTNSHWVESFGRVVLEAMAVGVPVILPKVYRPLFGEAALYAEPKEVQPLVHELVRSSKAYAERSARSLEFVKSQFSYSAHIERLGLKGGGNA